MAQRDYRFHDRQKERESWGKGSSQVTTGGVGGDKTARREAYQLKVQ